MSGSWRASSRTIRTTSRMRSGVASEDPPNLRTLNTSREDRVGLVVVIAIDEAVDGGVLGLERFDHREQLRGLQDCKALRVQVQELDVAVALAHRDVLPRDRTDAGAIQVGDLLEVEQDPRAKVTQRVHPLHERWDTILEHQPALEVQDDDATDLTLGNLHRRKVLLILAPSVT